MKHSNAALQEAETLALQAVAFLAGDDDRVSTFMAVSGISLDALRRSVGDKAMLAGILDYILANESLLLEFAENAGITPESVMRARQALPGFEHL